MRGRYFAQVHRMVGPPSSAKEGGMHPVDQRDIPSPAVGAVLHIFWMMFGNGALAIVAASIALESRGSP